MSVSNRGLRGKGSAYADRKSQDIPENIGNRRTFDEIKIPPDDVGNQIERDLVTSFVHDGLGNSLDGEPAHLQSGTLYQHRGPRGRMAERRVQIRAGQKTETRDLHAAEHSAFARPASLVADPKKLLELEGDAYVAHLVGEFSRLLAQKLGAPFSFSMKPVLDKKLDEAELANMLDGLAQFLRDILDAAAVNAEITCAQYQTERHRFAVFFVAPHEKDPIKNKDLISALRQILKLHATKYPAEQINVLLVLANARHVIEEHLHKIGAQKIDHC